MIRAFVFLIVAAIAGAGPAAAFDTTATAGIIVDFRSGDVLFEKEADVPLPPASMSKLMTAYLVFERLDEGTLTLDDLLPVSEKAWRTGGSKMFVEVGDRVAVEDLLRGMIVQSGNDACIVFAEALAGSEEAFAQAMNEKARELGLRDSHFMNSTGLPHDEHVMSVRDLAKLAEAIIRDFPQYYRYYSVSEFTYNDILQYNRNPLLRANVEGIDGMKTGYTEAAGYGLVASAERDGRRLIMVVAGLQSSRDRRSESERLIEHGFRDFSEYRLFDAGEVVAEASVWQGAVPRVPLIAESMVAITLSREARETLSVKLRYPEPVKAPVAKGAVVGEIEIIADGKPARTVPLVAGADVEEAGMLGKITGAVNYLVWGE